jgi:molecular chaperone DnaJ
VENKDLYKILEVDKDASFEDIKKSYRRLSMKYHPDRNPDDKKAEEKFKELSVAYSTLSDPQKRKKYDNPNSGFNPFEDFLRGFGGFGGMRTNIRPRMRPDHNSPMKGIQVDVVVDVPLRKFILREEVDFNMNFIDVCVDCKGTGAEKLERCKNCEGSGQVLDVRSSQGMFIQSTTMCKRCSGRGFIPIEKCKKCKSSGRIEVKDKKIKMKIDKDMRDGSRTRLGNAGGKGLNGGPDGDVIVQLNMILPKKEDLTEEQIKVLKEM